MSKKEIVILAGILLIAFFVFKPYSGFLAVGFQGASTLSVSDVKLSAKDPNSFFSGEAIQATFTGNSKINQSYYGTLSKDAINSSLDGKTVSKGFQASLQDLTSSCQYNINKNGQETKLYSYGVKYLDGDCFLGVCFKADLKKLTQQCQSLGEIISVGHTYFNNVVSNRAYCLYRNQTSKYQGTIQTVGDIYFNANVSFKIDGKLETVKNVSNTNQQVLFGNNAYLIWQGNLVSGEQCESPIDKKITAIYRNGWIVTGQELINQTKQNESVLLNGLSKITEDDLEEGVSAINNGVNYIYGGVNWKPRYAEETASITNNGLTTGRITYHLSELLNYPVFSMTIKASDLGIYTAIPKIRINYVKGTVFRNAGNGSFEVNLTNIGDETGSFEVSTECNNNAINQQGMNLNPSFSARETKSVFMGLTGSCNQAITTQCRAKVSVLGQPIYSAYANVTCNPNLTCEPNRTGCIENKIFRCSSDGTIDNLVKDCTALGQVCGTNSLGQLDCVFKDNGDGGKKTCSTFWEQYRETNKSAIFGNFGTGLFETGLFGTEKETGCFTADWVYLLVFSGVAVILGFLALRRN